MKNHLFFIWSLVAVLVMILGIFKITRQIPQLTQLDPTQIENELRLVAAGSPPPSVPPRAPGAGGVKNIYGQEWINNADGSQTVIGPCGTAACTGVWKDGGWDPNYNKPGAATPVPIKKSSSSGGGDFTYHQDYYGHRYANPSTASFEPDPWTKH